MTESGTNETPEKSKCVVNIKASALSSKKNWNHKTS